MPGRKKLPEQKPEGKKLPEKKKKKDDPAGPDVPLPSASSKPGHWKDKIERKSRAIDKELGFDEVTAENADDWLNARMNRIAEESRQRSEASWVQLQAGLDFQQKMSRGVLPGTKETPPPPPPPSSIDVFAPRITRQQKATIETIMSQGDEAQRKTTPEVEDNDEPPPLFGPLPQSSPSEEKLQKKRGPSPGLYPFAKRRPSDRMSHPPQANGDEMPPAEAADPLTRSPPPVKQENDDDKPDIDDADIQSVRCPRRQPRTQGRHSPSQSHTEVVSKQDDSHDQRAQSRKRPRANPLDSNLGPGWDFHFVDGSRPTKARGSGYIS
ncbi:hypothetical protein PG997_000900 [Apiospora hydei]|uniref:Uncharacterized protein n=1 Tax=Apiospora hydei TaxID=1337664 RepID=A0ABR1XC44_9PEZI